MSKLNYNLFFMALVLVLMAFVSYCLRNSGFNNTNYILPKSQWECTEIDVRPKHMNCTEYRLKK